MKDVRNKDLAKAQSIEASEHRRRARQLKNQMRNPVGIEEWKDCWEDSDYITHERLNKKARLL